MKLRKILEEFRDGVKIKGQYYEIFSNPSQKELKEIMKSIEEEDDGVRAIMTVDGTLYTATPAHQIIHDNLLEILSAKGIVKNIANWWRTKQSESYKNFLCVISGNHNFNDWFISESYFIFEDSEMIPNEYLEKYSKLFSKQGKNLITKEW